MAPAHIKKVVFHSICFLKSIILLKFPAIKNIVMIAIAFFIGSKKDEKGMRISALPNPNVAEMIDTTNASTKKIISLITC